ncbi:hypothetical protein M3202_13435 [Alkalihalobacillus oceani]|uniref:Uncharacterized protein n=1 Tax=Halalkalibacter oceani TaxID=1653776 RepID=A0A9X2IPC5_9BACI|nr:hypothetical protein [Halalkalibacter oceani]MCM3715085.1 hypothetical protein [Halalkalibacter oceani]
MELLDWLKERFAWQDVRLVNEALVETEQGRKRLRYWSDKELLDWHIEWRDHCRVTPFILADRMIRATNKEPALEWKDGWLTVHDEVTGTVPSKEVAEKIGLMIGTMIAFGLETEAAVEPVVKREPLYAELRESLPILPQEQHAFVSSLVREAAVRRKKAAALESKLADERLPLLDPLHFSKETRHVYQVMIWQGTMERPERGYFTVRSFLESWLEHYGKDGCLELWKGMQTYVSNEQAMLLLAELLKPYELDSLVTLLETNPTDAAISGEINQLVAKWERSKELVALLSSSIDSRRRVMTS